MRALIEAMERELKEAKATVSRIERAMAILKGKPAPDETPMPTHVQDGAPVTPDAPPTGERRRGRPPGTRNGAATAAPAAPVETEN